MKIIKFRPLRIIKKTGKITVASYQEWRKVMTADYHTFKLIASNDHLKMVKGDFVYNHKGEQLFFFDYNPSEVPVFNYNKSDQFFDLESIRNSNKYYGIRWADNGHTNYSMRGSDCDGVPTFSFYTANHIATHCKNIQDFEPITVGMVLKWYGWFLWQLENVYL